MNDELVAKINEEISRELDELEKLQVGKEDSQKAIDGIATLARLMMENEKNEHGFMKADEHDVVEDKELKLKYDQLSVQKKSKIFELAVAIATMLTSGLFYNAWINRGFKFEETGSHTSLTMRNILGKAGNFFKFK